MATERTIINKLIAYLKSKGVQEGSIHKGYEIPIDKTRTLFDEIFYNGKSLNQIVTEFN